MHGKVSTSRTIRLRGCTGIGSEETAGAEPCTLQERIPVHGREDVLLQVIERFSWDVLRAKDGFKGLFRNTSVFKFGKHELVVAGEQSCDQMASQVQYSLPSDRLALTATGIAIISTSECLVAS
jgi:hypothetical protein